MAKFYGTIKGARDSVATKTGTKNSGLRVSAQSWDGSVIVELWENQEGQAVFSFRFAEGSESAGGREFLRATAAELAEKVRG